MTPGCGNDPPYLQHYASGLTMTLVAPLAWRQGPTVALHDLAESSRTKQEGHTACSLTPQQHCINHMKQNMKLPRFTLEISERRRELCAKFKTDNGLNSFRVFGPKQGPTATLMRAKPHFNVINTRNADKSRGFTSRDRANAIGTRAGYNQRPQRQHYEPVRHRKRPGGLANRPVTVSSCLGHSGIKQCFEGRLPAIAACLRLSSGKAVLWW
jgi:hypothetical protein